MTDSLAGVVLAAGFGRRLQPLTSLRPKALCPLGQSTLLDHALERLAGFGLRGPAAVAVNAHDRAEQIVAAVGDRATMSVEPALLGSAGALGALASWLGVRPVLVTNADAYLAGGVEHFVSGWDGERLRLLVTRASGAAGDFGPWRFAGCSLLPWRMRRRLTAEPAGLYEALWRPEVEGGTADLIPCRTTFVDCGTPADYLAANLHQSGGETVVGARAVVAGTAVRCVVWPDSEVGPDEHLVDAVRAGSITVQATRTR